LNFLKKSGTSYFCCSSVVLVGVEQSLGHYHGVSLKLGSPSGGVAKARQNGRLVFVDVLAEAAEAYAQDRPLFDVRKKVCEALEELRAKEPARKIAVIVDKLSSLSSNPVSQSNTLRRLQHLCASRKADFIVASASASPMASALSHACHVLIDAWPLSTGHSQSVSGNVLVRRPSTGRRTQWQFKVEDRTVKLMAPGASMAVL